MPPKGFSQFFDTNGGRQTATHHTIFRAAETAPVFLPSACDFLPPGFGQIDQNCIFGLPKTSVKAPNNSSRSTNTNHEEKQKERHWLSVATSLQEGTPRGGNPSARQEHQLCFRNERQDQIHPQGETQEAPQRRRLSQQRFSWNLHPFS